MILKTAICDDEEIGIRTINRLIEYYHFETGVEFQKDFYSDPDALLTAYTEPGKYHLIFLDVEMPVHGEMKNGIDIARKIRSIPDANVRIIYISNYPSYMQMSFDVQASHYLDKNISYERFKTVLDSIICGLINDSALIRIKTSFDQWNLLRINDIICIRSFVAKRNKIAFCTANQELIENGRNILSIGEELKNQHFAFANKYCLVNMRHVTQYTHDHLQLSNMDYVEISRHFRKSFIEQFSNNILTL